MADDIDRASDLEERQRAQALLLRKPQLVNVGYCHFCGEHTAGLFCSLECREDWQSREDAKRRNGK